jgi:hypothetical protein
LIAYSSSRLRSVGFAKCLLDFYDSARWLHVRFRRNSRGSCILGWFFSGW